MLFFRIKYSFLTVLTFLCHSEEPFLFSLTRETAILWKNLMAPPSAYEDFAEMGRGVLVDYLTADIKRAFYFG